MTKLNWTYLLERIQAAMDGPEEPSTDEFAMLLEQAADALKSLPVIPLLSDGPWDLVTMPWFDDGDGPLQAVCVMLDEDGWSAGFLKPSRECWELRFRNPLIECRSRE